MKNSLRMLRRMCIIGSNVLLLTSLAVSSGPACFEDAGESSVSWDGIDANQALKHFSAAATVATPITATLGQRVFLEEDANASGNIAVLTVEALRVAADGTRTVLLSDGREVAEGAISLINPAEQGTTITSAFGLGSLVFPRSVLPADGRISDESTSAQVAAAALTVQSVEIRKDGISYTMTSGATLGENELAALPTFNIGQVVVNVSNVDDFVQRCPVKRDCEGSTCQPMPFSPGEVGIRTITLIAAQADGTVAYGFEDGSQALSSEIARTNTSFVDQTGREWQQNTEVGEVYSRGYMSYDTYTWGQSDTTFHYFAEFDGTQFILQSFSYSSDINPAPYEMDIHYYQTVCWAPVAAFHQSFWERNHE